MELERTMALLAFELPSPGVPPVSTSANASGKAKEKDSDAWSNSVVPPALADLLQPAQRQRTASEVNAAILTSQHHGPAPKLPDLLRLMAWGEELLSTKVAFPRLQMSDLLDQSKIVEPDKLPASPVAGETAMEL